jgi:hypothetical protein
MSFCILDRAFSLRWMKKPTNSVILQCIDTRHSPTCFGTLKCHHQEVNHHPAEIGAHLLQYTASIHLWFLQHWAPISAESWLTPWLWHFKVPKHVGECRVQIHWRISAFVGFCIHHHECVYISTRPPTVMSPTCVRTGTQLRVWLTDSYCSTSHLKRVVQNECIS